MTGTKNNWEITLCPMGNIRIHYQAAFGNVIENGLQGLAHELRQLADHLAMLDSNATAAASTNNPNRANALQPAVLKRSGAMTHAYSV
jgi:hypothetical protein